MENAKTHMGFLRLPVKCMVCSNPLPENQIQRDVYGRIVCINNCTCPACLLKRTNTNLPVDGRNCT